MVLEPRRRDDRHEELGTARIGAGIGHSQDTGFAEIEARTEFIRNRLFRAAAARTRRVAALDHEIGNDAMENRAIIKTGFCQIYKIFDRNRCLVCKKFYRKIAAVRLEHSVCFIVCHSNSLLFIYNKVLYTFILP